MKRRELLAGLGAAGVFGAGAAYHFGAIDPTGMLGEENGDRIEPVELSRIEAPGSAVGTETVPEAERVTYVALFATWCGTCASKMEPLNDAATAVTDDVQFLSVTNEPVGYTVDEADVAKWWADHDGNWPVAQDADLEFTQQVDAGGVPYSVVIDADNRLVWSDSGYKTSEAIRSAIDEAR